MDEFAEARYYRIYESIYRNMQRENELINYRLGWAIFTSGGIFAATAILANITVNINWEPVMLAPLYLAMAVLSALALGFSKLSLSGVWAAQKQHDSLRRHYDTHRSTFEAMQLPTPMGESWISDKGKTAALRFPRYLVMVWWLALWVQLALLLAVTVFAVWHYVDTGCLWIQDRPMISWPAFLAKGCPA
jgi:hypothetical protein